jgi:hypothetical protein
MQAIKIHNYKNIIRTMQLIALSVVFLSIGFSAYVYFSANQELQRLRSEIWVFNPVSGAAYKADLKQKSEGIRIVEYQHHVQNFYKLWYSYDQFDFLPNAEKALFLIGDAGKDLWERDKTVNNLSVLQDKNISVKIDIIEFEIFIDSEATDFLKNYQGYFNYAERSAWPIVGYIEAVQTLYSPGGKRSRNMNAIFSLEDLDNRTDENPHAVMIMDFYIYNDEIIN